MISSCGNAVLAALVALAHIAPCIGADAWTPSGPSGGAVRALAHDPTSGALYAGTYAGGVFKSNDSGASWISIAPEIRGQTVNALAVDPSAPRTNFAGTYSSGVWRSVDGGARRTESRNGMGAVNVQALLVDAGATGTIYAAAWSKVIFRSTDGGRTWTQVGGVPPHPDVITLAFDHAAPGRLPVGAGGGSVWRLDSGIR